MFGIEPPYNASGFAHDMSSGKLMNIPSRNNQKPTRCSFPIVPPRTSVIVNGDTRRSYAPSASSKELLVDGVVLNLAGFDLCFDTWAGGCPRRTCLRDN
jgi:hypothetical protein